MRILLLTNTPPPPAQGGGGPQRTAHLLAALERLGVVDLAFVTQPGLAATARWDLAASNGRRFGPFVWEAPRRVGPWRLGARLPGGVGLAFERAARADAAWTLEPTLAARLRSAIDPARYDVVVAGSLEALLRAGGLDLGLPVAIDAHDALDPVPPGPAIDRLAAARVARLRRRAFARAAHVWFSSEADRRASGLARASVLPNVPPGAVDPLPDDPASRTALFVGVFGYPPNREGLLAFAARAWPAVRARVSGARLVVAGPDLDDEGRRSLEAAGALVLGWVDDLAPLYRDAAIAIAPLRSGGGTRIKVLEAIARGRAVVATPAALHGLAEDLPHGTGAWHADGDAAMADGCVALLLDPALRGEVAARGTAVVAARFTRERFRLSVAEGVDRALADRGARGGRATAPPTSTPAAAG